MSNRAQDIKDLFSSVLLSIFEVILFFSFLSSPPPRQVGVQACI